MIEAIKIKALIFSYEDDEFNQPQGFKFLTEKYLNSEKLIGYQFGKGHYTFLNDCKLCKTKN